MGERTFKRLEPSLAQRAAALKTLPKDSLFQGHAAVLFATARLRIWRRYDSWRRNLPTIEGLFDEEAAGAQAIAGNLGTEGSAIVKAWLAACPPGFGNESERIAWVERFLEAWSSAAMGVIQDTGWAEDARKVFERVLKELMGNAHTHAAEQIFATHLPSGHVRLGILRRVTLRAGRLLLRIFDPPRLD